MPNAPKRPCGHPGCGRLDCERHKRAPDYRGTRQKKYDKRAWRDGTRPQKLRHDPLCEDCKERGLVVAAQHVDHVDGNSDNDAWDNLRSLCHSCHSRKTATQDGGFGNRRTNNP